MTDGVPSEGLLGDDLAAHFSSEFARVEDIFQFYYLIGDVAGEDNVLDTVACEQDGLLYDLVDGADLPSVMASYFTVLAVG